jgi:hypothetical protein
VPDATVASAAPSAAAAAGGASQVRSPSRVSFDVPPGKIQLRISVEGSAAQVLDSETREISVPDMTAAQALLGTPAVLRARTAREFQQLRTDPDAVPTAGREFNRIEHLLIRVPTYGPGGTTPELRVHLLNRTGAAMNELKAEPSPKAGEQQIDLALAALPPGEYVVEIKTGDKDGEASELLGFRVTG